MSERLEPQDWMIQPATERVLAALTAAGTEVRFVGGCVRDALAGRPVRDIDLATPDPPERVMELLEQAGIKALPTGIAHGTVTAVADHRPFEITTLRRDVETFGRRAKVAFTDDWRSDAARRDFTINALSAAPDGRLFDYFGGLADLKAGRVRFVGDPRARIGEDYLRLLRFFRFHAWYGRGAPDEDSLAAAREAAPHLARLSAERVREELLRLLAAPDPAEVIGVMLANDILAAELPEAREVETLDRLLALEPPPGDPLLRLAALITPGSSATSIARRLRFSVKEQGRLSLLLSPPLAVAPAMEAQALKLALYRLGRRETLDLLRLEAARSGRTEGLSEALAFAESWPIPHFPLKGRDLLSRGMKAGPEVGERLAELESWWIAEDFLPDRAALLAELERRRGARRPQG